MNGWNIDRIKATGLPYKIIGSGDKVSGIGQEKPKRSKIEPIGKLFIENLLKAHGIEYVKELKFAEDRKFRFDFAIPSIKVGLEYDGLFSAKSRHTTAVGFSKDAEKINLAQALGWRAFRYTALNYKNFENDIKILKPTL